MTYKIYFSGIDGSGKSTCADLLTAKLGLRYRVVRASSRGFYMYSNGENSKIAKRPFVKKSASVRTRLGALYGVFLIVNLLYKVAASVQVKLLTKPDLLIYEVDTVLHPAAYITYHFPITHHLRKQWRFGVLNALFGSRDSSIRIYLSIDPPTALERIKNRGADGGAHENLRDLTELKSELDGLVELAVKTGFDIVTMDANIRAANEIVQDVERMVDRKLQVSRLCSAHAGSSKNMVG